MPARDDLVLAIAAYKVPRTTPPKMPAPGEASIEAMGRMSRAIAAFEAGDTVYDVVVQAELVGQHIAGGTAELNVEGILLVDLELTAARAVATLARGIGERVLAEAQQAAAEGQAALEPPPPGQG